MVNVRGTANDRAGTVAASITASVEAAVANIFESDSVENPVTLIKQTLSVKPDDNGQVMVSFTANKGKGSGAQVLPASEYRNVVAVLADAVKNGVPEREDEDVPPSEMVRRTITIEDGFISFRVKGGKGAKPARLPMDQFAAVVQLLASTVDAVEKAANKLKK